MFLEYKDPFRAEEKKKKIDNLVFENSSKTGFGNEQFIGKEIRKNGLLNLGISYMNGLGRKKKNSNLG